MGTQDVCSNGRGDQLVTTEYAVRGIVRLFAPVAWSTEIQTSPVPFSCSGARALPPVETLQTGSWRARKLVRPVSWRGLSSLTESYRCNAQEVQSGTVDPEKLAADKFEQAGLLGTS